MKLNKRRIVIAVILLLVTVLAVVSELTLRRRRDSESGKPAAELAMPVFRPEDVREVEISWRDQKSTLTFDNGYWALKERGNAQAASVQIADLIEELAKVVPMKELTISGAMDYREYALVSDQETAAANEESDPTKAELEMAKGILIILRDAKGTELLRLMLGTGYRRPSAEGFPPLVLPGQEYDPDGRFIRVWYPDKTSRVFLLSSVLKYYVPNPIQWIEQLRIDPRIPRYVLFQRKRPDTKTFSSVWFANTDRTKDEFKLIEPDGELDKEAFGRILTVLALPFSKDIELNPGDLQFTERFQMVFHDGFSYLLEIAKRCEISDGVEIEKCFGRMTVSFDPDKVRRPAGESDESFERLKKRLAARAEYEMRTANGRVFRLRDDLPDILGRPPVQTSLRAARPRPATQQPLPAPKKEE